jgi:hypothetical protein
MPIHQQKLKKFGFVVEWRTQIVLDWRL